MENIRGSPSISSAEATAGTNWQVPPDCHWKEEQPISLAKKSRGQTSVEFFRVLLSRETAETSPASRADTHI